MLFLHILKKKHCLICVLFQTVRGQALLLEYSYCRSDHWIAQVRRDHRRSPGKPPAWSRVSYQVRPGCSGLFPVRTTPFESVQFQCSYIYCILSPIQYTQRAVIQSTSTPLILQPEQAQFPQPQVRAHALVSGCYNGNSINLLPVFGVFQWELEQAIYQIIGEHAFIPILCTIVVDCCMEYVYEVRK